MKQIEHIQADIVNKYFNTLQATGYLNNRKTLDVFFTVALIDCLDIFKEFVTEEFITDIDRILTNLGCCNCHISYENFIKSNTTPINGIASDEIIPSSTITPTTPTNPDSPDNPNNGNEDSGGESTDEEPDTPITMCEYVRPLYELEVGQYYQDILFTYEAGTLLKIGNNLTDAADYCNNNDVIVNDRNERKPTTFASINDTIVCVLLRTYANNNHRVVAISNNGNVYINNNTNDSNRFNVYGWSLSSWITGCR